MNEHDDRIPGLERLPRSRAPARDLWPGIESRLAPRRRSRYPLFQFALAASLVAGLAAMFTLSLSRAPVAGSAEVAGSSLPLRVMTHDSRAIVQANIGLVRQAQRQLRQALDQDPESASLRSLLASAEHRERELRALL